MSTQPSTKAAKAKAKQKLLAKTTSNQKKDLIRTIRGRGDYWSDFKDWAFSPVNGGPSRANDAIRGAAMGAAGALGAPAPLANMAGSAASWLSKIVGMGKYHVRKNSLWTGRRHPSGVGTLVEGGRHVNRPPTFATSGTGSDVIIAHEEFVADVYPSTAFKIQTYINNPGNPALMPWMSTLAGLYEEFELLGMVYCYKSTCATVAASSTNMGLGTVILATDYDCLDTSFINKRAMEAAEYSTSAGPLEHQCHPIECDPRRNVLGTNYVAPGVTTVGAVSGDARFSIPSVTSLAVVNMPTSSGTAIGELWVSYQVRCSRPIMETFNPGFTQHLRFTTTGGNVPSVPTLIENTTVGGSPFTVGTYGTGVSTYFTINLASNQAPGKFLVVYNANNNSNLLNYAWTQPQFAYVTGTAQLPLVSSANGGVHNTPLALGGGSSSNFSGCAAGVAAIMVTYNAEGDGLGMGIMIPSTTAISVSHDIFITAFPLGLTSRRGKSNEQLIEQAVERALASKDSKREADEPQAYNEHITRDQEEALTAASALPPATQQPPHQPASSARNTRPPSGVSPASDPRNRPNPPDGWMYDSDWNFVKIPNDQK